MKNNPITATAIGFAFLFLLGCQRDDVTSAQVPKESVGPAAMGATDPHAGHDHGHGQVPDDSLHWTVPKGWAEQPPSSMRVGSFLATAPNGQTVDISVIPLSGPAGGTLANINRWRGQIGLGPIGEADLPSVTQTLKVGGHDISIVDFVSEKNLIDNKHKLRSVTAFSSIGNRTWFFKMTGEDKAVQAIKPSFDAFLKSLQFEPHG